MASRPTWKGFIRFSLVSIPVKAYSAALTDSDGVTLNQIHKDCGARIKYSKVCPVHGELKSDDIVSAYEFADDQYVPIDPEELTKLRTKNDRTIDIDAFIADKQIDPRFYSGRTLYLTPDGGIGGKPYVMLHRLLMEEKKVAFCSGVFNNREQRLLLRPEEKLIAGTFLRYEEQMKPLTEFEAEVPDVDVDATELDLGRTLVAQLEDRGFKFSDYTDHYRQELQKLVEAKIEGKDVIESPQAEEPRVINLMEALQKSLDQAKARAQPVRITKPSTAAKRATAQRRKKA